MCPLKTDKRYTELVRLLGETRGLMAWQAEQADLDTDSYKPTNAEELLYSELETNFEFYTQQYKDYLGGEKDFDKVLEMFYTRIKGASYINGKLLKAGIEITLFPTDANPTTVPLNQVERTLAILKKKFGFDYLVINDPSIPFSGKYIGGTSPVAVVNMAYATPDTPFHEFYHPFVHLLKEENPELFYAILQETPESEESEEERVTQYLGVAIQTRQSTSFIQSVLTWIKAIFSRKTGKQINELSTIGDVLKLLDSKIKIDVSRSDLSYSYQILEDIKKAMAQKFSGSFTPTSSKEDIIKKVLSEPIWTTEDNSDYYTKDDAKVLRLTQLVSSENHGVFSLKYKGKKGVSAYTAERTFRSAGIPLDGAITLDGRKMNLGELTAHYEIKDSQFRYEGKMLHAYFNHLLETDSVLKGNAYKEFVKYAALAGYETTTPEQIYSAKEIKKNLHAILEEMQIDSSDRFAAEISVVDEALGLGTTADGLIQHDSGDLSLIDWKTGRLFSDANFNGFLAYGNAYGIRDTKFEKASLELVFRALMLKRKYPEAKFRNIALGVVNNGEARRYDINIEPHLLMISDYLKETNPALWEQMNAQRLFDFKIYQATSAALVEKFPDLNGMPFEEQVEKLQAEINDVVLTTPKELLDSADSYQKRRLAEATDRLLELKKSPHINLSDAGTDLTSITKRFSNMSDISNSKVKVLHQITIEAEQAMRKESSLIEKEHLRLAEAVLVEKNYRQRGIIRSTAKTIVAGAILFTNPWLLPSVLLTNTLIDKFVFPNVNEAWDFMWRRWDIPGKQGYFMNTKSTYLKDGVEVPLTQAQLAYRDFYRSSMVNSWNDVMKREVTNPKNGRTQTMAEIYNFPPDLPDDFMPRIPATISELRNREGFMESGFGFGTTMKMIGQKYLGRFFDSVYYGDLTKGGMSVKYFGHTNSRVVEEENHTLNAEAGFAGFMSSLLRKKHLDDVLSLYEGTKNALLMEKSDIGGPKFENLAEMLDSQIYTRILNRQKEGRAASRLGSFSIKGNLASKLGIKEGTYDIDQDQVLRMVRSAVSHSVMGFKFIGPVFNFAFITMVNTSQGLKAILKHPFKVADEYEPTFKDVALGLKDVVKYWGNVLQGKETDNKLWNLAKKSGWMPDNYSQALGQETLLSASPASDFNNMAFMFNSLVETYGSMWHLSMMLRAHKFKKGDKLVSYYDAYDDQGNWTGGTRGQVEVTPGVFKDLDEPDALEWKNLKRQYEQLHGSYRQEEKLAIEATIWGSFIVQFKKYFFQYLKVLYNNPYKDITMGRYVLDKDISRPDGVPVWKWEQEMLQGRLRALTASLLATAKLTTMSTKEIKALPPNTRKQLMYLVNTMVWFGLASLALGPDDEDDKSTYMSFRTKRLVEDMSMGIHPLDILHTIEKPIVAVSTIAKFGESVIDFLSGAETKQGLRKGLKGLESAIPGVSGVRQLQQIASQEQFGTDYLFGIIPISNEGSKNR